MQDKNESSEMVSRKVARRKCTLIYASRIFCMGEFGKRIVVIFHSVCKASDVYVSKDTFLYLARIYYIFPSLRQCMETVRLWNISSHTPTTR
jgi:hypothetical protein